MMQLSGLDTAARTVWGEARGDPASQLAVAAVLFNRLKSGKHGKTLDEVAKQPRQFSSWNEDDPNRPQMEALPAQDPQLKRLREMLIQLIQGQVADPTGGATHYFSGNVKPNWDWNKLEPAGVIGAHQFYRERRR